MRRAGLRSRLLLAILTTGTLGGKLALAHAVSPSGQATARIVAEVAAHITISAPVIIAVDLREHQNGSPIPAHVQFRVQANVPEVELQVACTDLYQAGDPLSAYRIPVAGAGAWITCGSGHALACGNSLLSWQSSPLPGLLPVGWTGMVSAAGTFTAAPAAVFRQNVTVDVSWNATDPGLPLGEYRGYVRLIGLIRP
jgi:hypothetical protein